MTNVGYSDSPRVRRFAGYVGWLLLFVVPGVILEWVIPARNDPNANPDNKDQPFAQVSYDDYESPVWSLAVSPDNTWLASATVSGQVSLKNRQNGQRNVIQLGQMGTAQSLAFSHDGRALAVAGFGPAIRILAPASGEETKPWEIAAENDATRLAFSPDGKLLASGGVRSITTIWEWSSRRRLAVLNGQSGSITVLAFSPDGAAVVTGDSAGMVKLWDVATGGQRTAFRAAKPGNGVTSLAISPDGKQLATASYLERTLRLWSVVGGALRSELPKMALGVRGLAFSPDGAILAIAVGDGTAVLWGIQEDQPLCSLQANTRGLQSIAFADGGRMLATGGTDGYVRLWDVAQALAQGSSIALTGKN